MIDYKKYYSLDRLLDDIRENFLRQGALSSEDFFCIVIWKANRSKSKMARRLKRVTGKDLGHSVTMLTREIFSIHDARGKLELLIKKWGFRLPMASAILAALYPNEFSVYDVRVCSMLKGRFDDLSNKTKFEKIWSGYCDFLEAVNVAVPHEKTYRKKDQYLWGKSFHEDLTAFISTNE